MAHLSREAAQEYSPRRKSWVQRGNTISPSGAQEESTGTPEREVSLAPGETGEADFVLGVGLEEFSAPHNVVSAWFLLIFLVLELVSTDREEVLPEMGWLSCLPVCARQLGSPFLS